jgi:glycosyltransferase involved in cell wall biosynthesis
MVSALDGAGPGRVMSILARELVAEGSDCLLVATHGRQDPALVRETRAAGVVVEALAMKRMWDLAAVGRLRDTLRRWRPDVVHTRTIRADLLGRVAAPRGVPVVNNIVNLYPEDCLVRLGPVAGRGVMRLARGTQGAARLFVANARAIADNVREAFGVSADRVRVVYDGLALEEWREAPPADLSGEGISDDDVVCLTVARLHPQKGLGDLLAAVPEVLKARPGTRFVVAGDGPEHAALAREVRLRGLERHVRLLGNRSDVARLMARADLFVLPSRFEGLPSAIIEAMAAGRAVVATDTAGTPELVDDGVTGWLVPPAAPERLAHGVLRALDRDLEQVGAAGRRRAEELFSAAAMTRGFQRVYEDARDG